MENLSELAAMYPNVKILHFHVDVKNNRMDFKVSMVEWLNHLLFELFNFLTPFIPLFQFQLKEGPRHVPHYGLMLAGVAGLPASVIQTAKSITAKIIEKVVSLWSCTYAEIDMI